MQQSTIFATICCVLLLSITILQSSQVSARSRQPQPDKSSQSAQAEAQSQKRVNDYPGEILTLDDEFDTLNLRLWKHELNAGGGGNWEFEAYVNNRSNSYVRDGYLYLKPTYTNDQLAIDVEQNGATLDLWGMDPASLCTSNDFYGCTRTTSGSTIINPIMSARVRTAEYFAFKYGRVEVRAKLPRGDWLWPALWLLPVDQQFGVWPTSGEIDIMESRGNAASYKYGGVNAYGSTLHFGPNYHYNAYTATHKTYTLPSGDFNQDFHIFGFYWDQSKMYTYLDQDTPANRVLDVDVSGASFWDVGCQVQNWDKLNLSDPWAGQPNNAPFNQMYYLIMNLAVGGTGGYFPDGPEKPWSDTSTIAPQQFWQAKGQWQPSWNGEQSAMVVDYVKVWTFNQSEFRMGNTHVDKLQVQDELATFRTSLKDLKN